MNVIVFDASSSFGCFRKSFTTTNALTHSIIPRSAVEGLVGAILGFTHNEYPLFLEKSNIAVQILSEVRKINLKVKYVNPDWLFNVIPKYLENKTPSKKFILSVPASMEVLVNPKYRIFFDGGSKINSKLLGFLEAKSSYYTPYLGSSSMICSAHLVGKFNYSISKRNTFQVSSVVSFLDDIPQIQLDGNTSKFAIEENLPAHIDNERKLGGTYKIVYSPNANKIPISNDKKIYLVKMGNETAYVKFLPTFCSS